MPTVYGTEIPTHATVIDVFDPSLAKIVPLEIPVLLASDVLHSLWVKGNKKLWQTCIGVTSESCTAYWQYASEEWAASHPVIQPIGCQERFHW